MEEISAAARRKLPFAEKIAALDATILIRAASCVDKDFLAHFLHEKSPRAASPFSLLLCDSSTDASALEEAFRSPAEGTLYIDDVAALNGAAQKVLLQFLDKKAGTERPQVIAASSLNLEDLTESGAFDRALFFRLNVLCLNALGRGGRGAEWNASDADGLREIEEIYSSGKTLKEAMAAFKAAYVRKALAENKGNVTVTAKALNIQRTYLSRLAHELKLK